ncbi:hypothetical protein GDO81_007642 [Engystomops pustulosus]|uniref:Uncharacterized protein n=1 Tax=Engystomops pustulosus TaxID=76066 RepID=A0AAV7C9P7_ENGPU|nr:hypothetical protein GDO81_007642 [Engystomops pustulosus]
MMVTSWPQNCHPSSQLLDRPLYTEDSSGFPGLCWQSTLCREDPVLRERAAIGCGNLGAPVAALYLRQVRTLIR